MDSQGMGWTSRKVSLALSPVLSDSAIADSRSRDRFYVHAPALTIVGKPSASLADKLRDDAKAVVDANVKKYGEDGLAKLAKKVEDAQAENDKPIPPEILRDYKIPDVNGIDWIKVETGRSGGVAKEDGAKKGPVQDHLDADGAQLPLFVQYDRESLLSAESTDQVS